MIRKFYLLIPVIMAGFATVMAQDSEKRSKEEIFREVQEFKIKFLAQEMDLKEDQQDRFVKLYGEMNQKRFACMKDTAL